MAVSPETKVESSIMLGGNPSEIIHFEDQVHGYMEGWALVSTIRELS
jgi:hypothetical protein